MENLKEQYHIIDKASRKQKSIYNSILVTGFLICIFLISNFFISSSSGGPSNQHEIETLKIRNDFLTRQNSRLVDSIKVLDKRLLLIDTSGNTGATKKIFIFSEKEPEYSGEFHSAMIFDNKGNYEIELDKVPNHKDVSKVLYMWGNEESEQTVSSKKNFYAKFKTQKTITIDDIEILVFYKSRKIIVWKKR